MNMTVAHTRTCPAALFTRSARKVAVARSSARDSDYYVPPTYELPPPQPEFTTPLGETLSQWLQSPFDVAAFGPRLTVGALLSAPERLQNISAELEVIQELLNSPAPNEQKTENLMRELERSANDFLSRGAYVEADIVNQMKTLLPTDLAAQIPDIETPVTRTEPVMGPVSTSSGSVVTELPDDVEL